MKTLEEVQNAEVTICSGDTPLSQAKDAACFLTSCALGSELGQNSSIILHNHSEIDGLCRFLHDEGFINKEGFGSTGDDLSR